MKKLLTTLTIILSTVLSPALRAEALVDANTPVETETDSEGTPVGMAASEGSNAAKRRQWQNIAIAVGAVAVAVTALLLVASNDGHHASKGNSKS